MRQPAKDFIKIMGELDRSKHQGEIFRDFCELLYCALAKVASPFEDQRDRLEAQYMEVVGRYRNKDDIRRMPELRDIALFEISAGGCDFLGEVAGEMGVLNDRLGQFFTPFEVSRLMAEINLTGIEKKIKEEGFVTVQEPAAGAGGMLIAVADKVESLGFNLETSLWFEAVELSASTFHMCYIQSAARGMAGRVIHGNSLTVETYTSAFTAAAHVFHAKNGPPFAKQQAALKAAVAKEQEIKTARLIDMGEAPPITGKQLSLF
ncbi:MAG: N-6 DNA methylase [Thalassovita sp.]